MVSTTDLEILKNSGWLLVKNQSPVSRAELLEISYCLGVPKSSRINNDLIDVLVPINPEESFPKSLSAVYGKGAFPFHTDTAQWRTPARYIVLNAKKAGNSGRPTLLLDYLGLSFGASDEEKMHRGVYRVINGRNSFPTNLLERERDGQLIRVRFDRNCMFPMNQTATEAYAIFTRAIAESGTIEINWEDNDVLVIDNWRMLHRRGLPKYGNKDERVLERVLIMQS